jgi:thymidylate kinase
LAERGKLIVLEGTDDALLGDLSGSLCRWLREQQASVEGAREPTHGPAGSQVLLAWQGRLQLDATSLALLYLADRLDHLQREDGMLSWLDEGRNVVCVHYVVAAYARLWGQVDWAWQRRIEAPCRASDLTLFVDSEPTEADPLRAAYWEVIERLRADGQSVIVVEGRGGQDEVLGVCQQHVADLLGQARTPLPWG